MTQEFSPRETFTRELVAWLSKARRVSGGRVFNAPYGVLEGLEKGNKARGITFGVARVSDVHLSIYSPKFMILRDSRYGTAKYTDVAELKKDLMQNYGFRENYEVETEAD